MKENENHPHLGQEVLYEIGGQVLIGTITAIREQVELPYVYPDGVRYLPAYIEIDGDIQIPPHKVES